MLQQTSLSAFNQLNDRLRNDTYKAILLTLSNWPEGLTDREIASILSYPDPNKIRPRRNELAKYGLIYESDKRVCSISNKQSIVWKIYITVKAKNEFIGVSTR